MSTRSRSEDRGVVDAADPRCPRGHQMRIHQVRIDRRRVVHAGGIGGWERAISYDQWVCDFCGHREPPQPSNA